MPRTNLGTRRSKRTKPKSEQNDQAKEAEDQEAHLYTDSSCGEWPNKHCVLIRKMPTDDERKLLRCIDCLNSWDEGEEKWECRACGSIYCNRCITKNASQSSAHHKRNKAKPQSIFSQQPQQQQSQQNTHRQRPKTSSSETSQTPKTKKKCAPRIVANVNEATTNNNKEEIESELSDLCQHILESEMDSQQVIKPNSPIARGSNSKKRIVIDLLDSDSDDDDDDDNDVSVKEISFARSPPKKIKIERGLASEMGATDTSANMSNASFVVTNVEEKERETNGLCALIAVNKELLQTQNDCIEANRDRKSLLDANVRLESELKKMKQRNEELEDQNQELIKQCQDFEARITQLWDIIEKDKREQPKQEKDESEDSE